MTAAIAAIAAVGLAFGTWFYLRWSDATQRIDNLCALVMSIDLDDEAGS